MYIHIDYSVWQKGIKCDLKCDRNWDKNGECDIQSVTQIETEIVALHLKQDTHSYNVSWRANILEKKQRNSTAQNHKGHISFGFPTPAWY